MSRSIAKWLLIFNVSVWLINILLHYTGTYEPKLFGLSIQLTVAVLLGSSAYLFKFPESIKWFKKLDSQNEVNDTISFVLASLFNLPILIFNVFPLTSHFGS